NTKKVRWVPINGISTSAEANVPTSEPAVDIAYKRPVTVPVSATRPSASLFAYGATVPSSITGTATSTSTAANEPRNPPTDSAHHERDHAEHGDGPRMTGTGLRG